MKERYCVVSIGETRAARSRWSTAQRYQQHCSMEDFHSCTEPGVHFCHRRKST